MPLGRARSCVECGRFGPPQCSVQTLTAYFPNVREATLPADLSPMEGKEESRRRRVHGVYAVWEGAQRSSVRCPFWGWAGLTRRASPVVCSETGRERFGLGDSHGARSIPISDLPPRRAAGPGYKVRLTTLRTRAIA